MRRRGNIYPKGQQPPERRKPTKEGSKYTPKKRTPNHLSANTRLRLPEGYEITEKKYNIPKNKGTLSCQHWGNTIGELHFFMGNRGEKQQPTLIINQFTTGEPAVREWLLAQLIIGAKQKGLHRIAGDCDADSPDAQLYRKFNFSSIRDPTGGNGKDEHYLFVLNV